MRVPTGSSIAPPSKGEKWRQPLGNLLLHLAEHSSDHRGQLATLLRQVGAKPPEVDLLVSLEEKRLAEARFSGSSCPRTVIS
jgi:uncharacterized damage-inducible protein DinB